MSGKTNSAPEMKDSKPERSRSGNRQSSKILTPRSNATARTSKPTAFGSSSPRECITKSMENKKKMTPKKTTSLDKEGKKTLDFQSTFGELERAYEGADKLHQMKNHESMLKKIDGKECYNPKPVQKSDGITKVTETFKKVSLDSTVLAEKELLETTKEVVLLSADMSNFSSDLVKACDAKEENKENPDDTQRLDLVSEQSDSKVTDINKNLQLKASQRILIPPKIASKHENDVEGFLLLDLIHHQFLVTLNATAMVVENLFKDITILSDKWRNKSLINVEEVVSMGADYEQVIDIEQTEQKFDDFDDFSWELVGLANDLDGDDLILVPMYQIKNFMHMLHAHWLLQVGYKAFPRQSEIQNSVASVTYRIWFRQTRQLVTFSTVDPAYEYDSEAMKLLHRLQFIVMHVTKMIKDSWMNVMNGKDTTDTGKNEEVCKENLFDDQNGEMEDGEGAEEEIHLI